MADYPRDDRESDRDKLAKMTQAIHMVALGESIHHTMQINHFGRPVGFRAMTLQEFSTMRRFYIDREMRRRQMEPPEPIYITPQQMGLDGGSDG